MIVNSCFFVLFFLFIHLIRLGIHRELNVKQSYLEQFEEMAPNYMSEEFDAQIAEATALKTVLICVNPFHREFPGIQYIYRGKKEVSISRSLLITN